MERKSNRTLHRSKWNYSGSRLLSYLQCIQKNMIICGIFYNAGAYTVDVSHAEQTRFTTCNIQYPSDARYNAFRVRTHSNKEWNASASHVKRVRTRTETRLRLVCETCSPEDRNAVCSAFETRSKEDWNTFGPRPHTHVHENLISILLYFCTYTSYYFIT